MTIPCPACEWPEFLKECGPPEDPMLLLTGIARIGGAALRIVAIRTDPASRWSPDYRLDVPAGSYDADGLDIALEGALEELGSLAEQLNDILGESEQGAVSLAGRAYRLVML